MENSPGSPTLPLSVTRRGKCSPNFPLFSPRFLSQACTLSSSSSLNCPTRSTPDPRPASTFPEFRMYFLIFSFSLPFVTSCTSPCLFLLYNHCLPPFPLPSSLHPLVSTSMASIATVSSDRYSVASLACMLAKRMSPIISCYFSRNVAATLASCHRFVPSQRKGRSPSASRARRRIWNLLYVLPYLHYILQGHAAPKVAPRPSGHQGFHRVGSGPFLISTHSWFRLPRCSVFLLLLRIQYRITVQIVLTSGPRPFPLDSHFQIVLPVIFSVYLPFPTIPPRR